MGILDNDNRARHSTQGAAPFSSGTVPAQQQYPQHNAGLGHGANLAGSAAAGVNAGTLIPATQTAATGPAPNTAGPHKYDILNKLDPAVDSDLSKVTAAGVGAGGVSGIAGGHRNPGQTQHLPNLGQTQHHNLGQTQHHNHGQTQHHSGGANAGYGTAGPHQSDLANRLDPTVDSRTGLRK